MRPRTRFRKPNYFHELYNLVQKVKPNWIPSISNTGIHTLSSKLSATQTAALSLGLNFIPVPGLSSLSPKPETSKHNSNNDLPSFISHQCADFSRRINVSYHFLGKGNDRQRNPLKLPNKSWLPSEYHPLLLAYEEHVQQSLLSFIPKINRDRKPYNDEFWNPAWLLPALHEINKTTSVIVTLADKNMGIVVMDTDDYIREGERQLHDTTCYERLIEPSTRGDVMKLYAEIERLLFDYKLRWIPNTPKKLPTIEAAYILQDKIRIGKSTLNGTIKSAAKFYLLMKMHKSPPVGRPIVSTIGSPTYFASKYIDHMLKPLLRHIPSYVESSQHLIHQLETEAFPADCVICCADIESLYPNIPIIDGLRFVETAINRMRNEFRDIALHLRDDNIVHFIIALLKFILQNNYFVFGKQWYKQLQGTAMGTPAAVPFACLFVYEVEHRVFKATGLKPLFYKRYIDDLFFITRTNNEAAIFFDSFNNILPTIRCGAITINSRSGIFLDLEIFKGPRFADCAIFDFKTYQKAQNRYLYLAPNSFHSRSVYSSTIKSELNRYRLTCNSDSDFYSISSLFYQRLVARGFSTTFLDCVFSFPQSRSDLLRRLYDRYLPSAGKKAQKLSLKVFKTQLNMETIQIPYSEILRLPDSITSDPELYSFFGNRNPLVSFSNAKTSHIAVGSARKHLHMKDNV